MAHKIRRDISTNELAVRVQNELQSFHQDKLISSFDYRKCKKYISLIRAINHADRIVTRDMDLEAVVVVFVPADTNNVFLHENYRDWANYVDNIKGQTNLTTRDRNYFLGKEKFLNIISIPDRFLNIFSDYPAGGARQSAHFRKVSYEDYQGRIHTNEILSEQYFGRTYQDNRQDPLCYFSVSESRITLGTMFESPRYLQFTARVMPGNVNLDDIGEANVDNEDYNAYTVLAPHWSMELMIYETLLWLLPTSAKKARALCKQERDEQKLGHESQKPKDNNVIVPHFSY